MTTLFNIRNIRKIYTMNASVTRTISISDIDTFAQLTGDRNSVHFSDTKKKRPIVHGALLNGLVSGVIGTQCPGHGSLVISQSFSFPTKCYTDKPIKVNVQIVELRKIIKVKYWCEQDNNVVFEGDAKVIMNKEA